MKQNVGKVDRIIRILIGLVMIGVGIFYQSWWGAIGIIPIITGGLGWCPAYLPFNINTNK
ncbi:MAG: DUF2892 domain-containing protein [Leptonema sp. (in: bacteria)]